MNILDAITYKILPFVVKVIYYKPSAKLKLKQGGGFLTSYQINESEFLALTRKKILLIKEEGFPPIQIARGSLLGETLLVELQRAARMNNLFIPTKDRS